jgi:hypothetical protein
MVYSPLPCMRRNSALLLGTELRLFAAELALGPGHGHAFAGTHAEQVDLELGERGEDIEEHLPHRIGGVVELPAQGELDAAGDQGVADGASVGNRAGQAVEFGDHQGVAGAHGGEGLVESGTGAGGAGQPVVEVDLGFVDAEPDEGLALGR